MKKIIHIPKMLFLCMATLLLVLRPASVMAEEVVPISAMESTSTTTDTTAPTYTYNAETGHWDSDRWYFDADSGTYQPVLQPVTAQTPVVIDPQADPKSSGTVDQVNNSINQSDLVNAINSNAKSGNANVAINTLGGDAKSGDATAIANIINNVNSTMTTTGNQKAATFVKDVIGDVNGDILLQPILLKAMLESEANNTTNTVANLNNSSSLINNVDLNAVSGNANVIGNTTGGSATSGSANTVANVMNLINSMVASKQSFVGTINIYGNLNGDILIAPDFFSQLLASNGSNQPANGSTAINSNDTQSIVNNVSLAAQSGAAAVLDNTKAGDATTGDANTNLVIFNLSGHEVVAKDSLLVFVNVLGRWVGVILDAPGATAAAIGNGVASNNIVEPDLTINVDNNAQITNNLNLASMSGDATVMGNTLAGNATTGKATASANIANISNSSLGLSGWFGVLFINVFGNWFGSFGVDTPNGNPIPTNNVTPEVIQFIPKTNSSLQPISSVNKTKAPTSLSVISRNDDGGYSVSHGSEAAGILGGSDSPRGRGLAGHPTTDPLVNQQNLLLSASVFLGATSLLGVRRFRFNRKSLRLLKMRLILSRI